MKHELPKLDYPFDALEPYIDAQTMELHYTRHHQTYIDKLNQVLEKYPEYENRKLEELMMGFGELSMDEKDKTMFKNHGGGHLNHAFFWSIMAPAKDIDNSLVSEIAGAFGSLENFKKLFSDTASSHFGSGWAFLARDENGKLQVYSLPNQDSPYLKKHTPIIGLDLWEHAYYLKYQNRRPEYIQNWWNILKLL